jgi:hypothetical protein
MCFGNADGQNGGRAVMIVLDNVQAYARRRDQRIGSKNQMIIGTGATAIELEDCSPEALVLTPVIENWKKGQRQKLTVNDIIKSIDVTYLERVFMYHWIETLVAFVPALAPYRGLVQQHRAQDTQRHAINSKQHTNVHLLGTNSANEVMMRGMFEALTDFFDQMGFNVNSHENQIFFCSGDGKSFENIH